MSQFRIFLPAILFMMLLACAAPLLQTPEAATQPVLSRAPAQTAYYVAPGGDDSNPGTEIQPWENIQHAAD
ncbi:MAG: hypothetical protein DSY55_04130, partial [Clostridia bacterium]